MLRDRKKLKRPTRKGKSTMRGYGLTRARVKFAIPVNPDQVRAIEAKQAAQNAQNLKPAAESKTQVAVNSEGKTNEATKHSTKPLKKGQSQPTEKQVPSKEKKQTQNKSPAAPKKGTGRNGRPL